MKGVETGYFFVIRADDGDYNSKKAVKLTHSTSSVRFLLLSSSSILFTGYGTVLLTFTIDSENTSTRSKCDDGLDCASRMRIA